MLVKKKEPVGRNPYDEEECAPFCYDECYSQVGDSSSREFDDCYQECMNYCTEAT